MAKNPHPTPEQLRQLLVYDDTTGLFLWRARPLEMFPCHRSGNTWNARFSGKPAFISDDTHGYKFGRIFGRNLKAHRVAFALCHGYWPPGDVDHINGNRQDNRISNLRPASRAENLRNQIGSRGGTSKYLGVSWSTRRRKWIATVKPSGRNAKYLGQFDCEIDAAICRDVGAMKYHGAFASLNFPAIGNSGQSTQ